MLRFQSYFNALSYAARLDERAVAVTGGMSTPLAELIRHSLPVNYDIPTSFDDLRNFGYQLTAASEGSESQHSAFKDRLIEDLKQVVRPHLAFAQSTVAPEVAAFHQKLVEYCENATAPSAQSLYEIRVRDLPAVTGDDSFISQIEKYEGKPVLAPSQYFDFPAKTEEELHSMVLVANARLNKLILEWATALPEGFLSDVWMSFFSKQGPAKFDADGIRGMQAFDQLDIYLAVYLLTTKITADIQEASIDLNTYKRMALDYENFASAGTITALRRAESLIRGKLLILGSIPGASGVQVVGGNYRPWLEAGGKPEVVLGAFVSQSDLRSTSMIDEKAAQLESAWQRHVTFYNAAEQAKSFDSFKSALGSLFLASMEFTTENEKAYLADHPNYSVIAREKFDRFVETLTKADMGNLPKIATVAVADCKYYFSSAFEILCGIEDACIANPEIDVREAAHIAAIHYLSDYMVAQMAGAQ